MRKTLGCWLAGTLALTACQTGAPTRPGASASPVAPRASATASASGKPSAAPSMPGASLDPATMQTAMAQVRKLAPPVAGATTLRGQVKLDKAYLLAAGGGRAVGGAVAADGGQLIGNDGSTAIANARNQVVVSGAGNVIAAGDAKLIGNDGSTLIGNDGSTLVGNDGASLIGMEGALLIGNDGSTLIGNDGSTLIGNDGSTYRLAQAPDAGKAPVAGALVGAVDLRDGKPIAIGVGPDGKPVYLAYTDADGRFELFLPADLARNVLVVTSAAAAGKPDSRLALGVVAGGVGRGDVAIDETNALVSAYLRTCLTLRLVESMSSDQGAASGIAEGDEARILLQPLFESLDKAAADTGFKGLKAHARYRAVQAAVDALLADLPLETFKIHPLIAGPHPATADAFAILEAKIREVDQGVRDRIAAEPGYYARSEVVRAANLQRPTDRPWILERSSDYTNMLVQAFMSTSRGQAFDMVGLSAIELGLPAAIELSFEQAGLSIFAWVGQELQDEARAAAMDRTLRAAIMAEKAAARPEPAINAPPTPPPTTAGTGRKLATLPQAPGRDYREDAARMAVLAAPDGGVFVADGTGGQIFHVASAGTVRLLAAQGIGLPGGLALGPDGTLYFSDARHGTISRIVEPLGKAEVQPFAGARGVAGDAVDGPVSALEARFDNPEGLAFGPDGALYVADAGHHRIRRIDMAANGQPVTIYAGGHGAADDDGGYLDEDSGWTARFRFPRGLAFGARGLYVTTGGDGRIRLVQPGQDGVSGPVTTVGGGHPTPTTGDRPAFMTRLEVLGAIAAFPDGRLIVAEAKGQRLRAWRPDGWITTLRFGPEGPTWKRPLAVGTRPDGILFAGDAESREVWELKPGS